MEGAMSMHRYSRRGLASDYGCGLAGAGLNGGALWLAGGAAYSIVIFGGLTALFLLFTMRTAMRHRLRIEVNDEAIGPVGGSGGSLAWSRLDDVRLRYYAARRNRGGGWMTLTLRQGRRRLSLDSTIEGFETIAERAAAAAHANGIALAPTTIANFAALGMTRTDGGPARGTPGEVSA